LVKKPYEYVDLSLKKKLERELLSREEKETVKVFKVCLICKERKSLFSFSVDRRSSDGRNGACKICKGKQSLEYYYSHKEEILIQVEEYRKTHKIDRSIYFQNYQRDHKKHLKKIAKAWYKKNKKAIKKRNLKYYQENKEACLAIRELWREKNKEGIKKYNRGYKRKHKISKVVI